MKLVTSRVVYTLYAVVQVEDNGDRTTHGVYVSFKQARDAAIGIGEAGTEIYKLVREVRSVGDG